MDYTTIGTINEYSSESINPALFPDAEYEVYSVPVFETGHPEYLRGEQIGSTKQVVRKDDVLICKINPRINRVWVVSDESDNQSIASSEWIVVRAKKYNPEFLGWYFRSPKFKMLMVSEVTGIGGSLTRAQPKRVAGYPVPLLDRNQQDEIVQRLNSIKRIIKAREHQLFAFDILIKARFVEMFGTFPENPMGWEIGTIRDVVSDVRYGSSRPAVEGGKYPYSTISTPLYSTLPDEGSLESIQGYSAVRKAIRQDQRIILVNRGNEDKGFTICKSCGAAAPGNNAEKLKNRKRPGAGIHVPCRHDNTMNIVLGYDFLTDMLVLTFDLPKSEVEYQTIDAKTWMQRAGTTVAEALRKAATRLLDVEYDEIQAGYRIREDEANTSIDVYLYDNLSSGAGYSTQLGERTEELLQSTLNLLEDCDCDHACQKCLKHYRNQHIQVNLDRHAAIELIKYGQNRHIPEELDTDHALDSLIRIERLLRENGIRMEHNPQEIKLISRQKVKTCIVYPSMKKCPSEWRADSHVPVTIEALNDAKPYALATIMKLMQI